MNTEPRRMSVMGCPVDNLSFGETLDLIEGFIKSGKPHQHVVVNADKILKAKNDPELKNIIEKCDIINADGMAVVWASRLLGKPLKQRITGIDLMYALFEMANKRGYGVYFLGAKEDIVSSVSGICSQKYPNMRIAGFRNGYWTEPEEYGVVSAIRESRPDILFVAISSPKKELFLKKYLLEMNVPFVMGVGGSFDVFAGKTSRAPFWMQKAGLEWLFRLAQEPGRMWRRYLIGNIKFLNLLAAELFNNVLKRSKK